MDKNYSVQVLKDALEDARIERNAWASVYRERGNEVDKNTVENLDTKIKDLEMTLTMLYA